jgi:hypothetical protein
MSFLKGVLVLLFTAAVLHANDIQGPSSSQPPYVIRAVKGSGVNTKSILTVGDTVNLKPDFSPYYLVGIPDGLGAFDNGDGTFTVLMNHELSSGEGITRAHGGSGAFVSKWIIQKSDLKVLHGEDLIQQVATWNTITNEWNSPASGINFARFCSADLASQSAFYDSDTGLGSTDRLFLNGEENGTEGRMFAHTLAGISYELPRFGKFNTENSVAHPGGGFNTVVIALDDTAGGQLYIYVGQKTSSPNSVEAAGLANGNLYGLKVTDLVTETNTTILAGPAPFTLQNFGDVSGLSGAQLEAASIANSVTGFMRPEDGSWDPSHPNDFYFVTTASFTTNSRLWRLRFVDASNPVLGGTIEMLLIGSEGQKMMDNITVNRRGDILIQEDPGNQPHIAKVWQYDIANDSLKLVAQHDPALFQPGAAGFLTQDEESSGIIDASSILGEGWFLFDVQAHYAIAGQLVQGGQLLAIHVPFGRK